jgi:hypothetical protein
MSRRGAAGPIPADQLVIQHSVVGYGVHQFTAWWGDYQGPAGVVWAHMWQCRAGIAVMVLNSFVPTWLRRRGVRTAINAEILRKAAVVMTSDDSEPSGRAFMAARGYRRDGLAGLMVLRAAKPGPKRAPRRRRGRPGRRPRPDEEVGK